MTTESKRSLLEARLKRLNERSLRTDNAGARRKVQRQIRNLTVAEKEREKTK